jgi:hypothetical protein
MGSFVAVCGCIGLGDFLSSHGVSGRATPPSATARTNTRRTQALFVYDSTSDAGGWDLASLCHSDKLNSKWNLQRRRVTLLLLLLLRYLS